MVVHRCQNCRKVFASKGDYDRHMNRKNPCIDVNETNLLKKIENIVKSNDELLKSNQKLVEMNKKISDKLKKTEIAIKNIDKTINVIKKNNKPKKYYKDVNNRFEELERMLMEVMKAVI
jgi:uncharacterized C2H2 Zn-finger protein